MLEALKSLVANRNVQGYFVVDVGGKRGSGSDGEQCQKLQSTQSVLAQVKQPYVKAEL